MALIDDMGLLCVSIDSGDGNKITGRTKLQKTIYFCRYLGWDINDYRLHYYGPFSPTLTSVTEMAESTGLVKQGEVGPPYTFTLTDKGRDLMKKFTKDICNPEKVRKTRDLVKYLSGWSREELEVVATIDYVHSNSPDMDMGELLDKVYTIKPNFSPNDIKNAYDKWTKLKPLLKTYSVTHK